MFRFFVFSVLIILVFLAGLSLAGIPKMINYQGMLTDNSGTPLSGSYTIIFKIYNDPSAGTKKWEETQSGVLVTNGLFNVILGNVTPISLDFSEDYWLDITVGAEHMPTRLKFTSVGYAYRAQWSDTASYARSGGGGSGSPWIFRITDTADTTISTGGVWGITRIGNTLYGNADSTHVNLGVGCITGTSGQNYKYCTVGGGRWNTASAPNATVGGGVSNTASAACAAVGGGAFNVASEQGATVGGGDYNIASKLAATVGGGHNNFATGIFAATVGGGSFNVASGSCATVGGGWHNAASGDSATVGGGCYDYASGINATVGGGRNNNASGIYSTVGGGSSNVASGSYSATVAGGASNTADGQDATVGGGYQNRAFGYGSVAPGGSADTVAGDYSFAAGRQVRITSDADYTFAFGRDFRTSTPNAVIFSHPSSATRVGINKTDPAYAIDLPNNANASGQGRANAWNIYSSRRWKENINPIEDALEKTLALRGVFFEWKESKKHDMGFIAEEVGQVIPEVVTYEENGKDAQAMDYARLTALLVEAIREQQREIESLKEEIKALQIDER